MDLLRKLGTRFTIGDGCWEWTGGLDSKGYGQVWHNGRNHKAHRVTYELLRGPVPQGLELDHLCRNRACVRPSHLEAVTHRENILRGENFIAQNARKTHCPQGHELKPDNLVPSLLPYRKCYICAMDSLHRYRTKKRNGRPDIIRIAAEEDPQTRVRVLP